MVLHNVTSAFQVSEYIIRKKKKKKKVSKIYENVSIIRAHSDTERNLAFVFHLLLVMVMVCCFFWFVLFFK